MNTLEMEVALIKASHIRQNLVVPNVSWGLCNEDGRLHECDLLVLSRSDYATEIEIKISKSDLLKDFEKNHKHDHNLIRKFYFAVPKQLEELALNSIPDRAGLMTVELIPALKVKWLASGGKIEVPYFYKRVRTIKEAVINKNARKWTQEERYQLARLGALRILGLKEKLLETK